MNKTRTQTKNLCAGYCLFHRQIRHDPVIVLDAVCTGAKGAVLLLCRIEAATAAVTLDGFDVEAVILRCRCASAHRHAEYFAAMADCPLLAGNNVHIQIEVDIQISASPVR